MTLETNEQILHQMNINLELLEVSDCRLTQTLSVTSTTKTACIKTVLDKNKIPKNTIVKNVLKSNRTEQVVEIGKIDTPKHKYIMLTFLAWYRHFNKKWRGYY
jgi:hypothetical protein